MGMGKIHFLENIKEKRVEISTMSLKTLQFCIYAK